MESHICPITQEPMKHPVIASDGHSYEESAINKWFLTSNKSPLTGLTLTSTRLIPNHALRKIIEENGQIKTEPILNVSNVETSKIELKNYNVSDINGQIIVSPPENALSIPIAIVAVIDISGSMGLHCTENDDSEVKFTRLDIVKHSIKTIGYLLRDCDLLSIITFNENCKIVFPWSQMNKENIVKMNSVLDSIEECGSTNLIAGFIAGMDQTNTIDSSKYFVNVCFLTDGEHTTHVPNMGLFKSIESKYDSLKNNVIVNTIAYGYGPNLDSKLMYEVAEKCNGFYAYVPDGSMVGTIFINLISNLQNVYIDHFNMKSKFPDLHGNLQTDQSRIIYNAEKSTIDYIGVQTEFVNVLKRVIEFGYNDQLENAKILVMNFYNLIQTLEDPMIIRIKNDIYNPDKHKGQILKAIENWRKWGIHYLPYVYMSHIRQERSNFKDESMKNYGSKNLENLLNKGDILFTTVIPPPVSTYTTRGASGNTRTTLNNRQFTQSYYNTQGGCFTGDTFIKLHSGMYRRISQINKNDLLYRLDKNGKKDIDGVKIKCIVKIKYNDKICILNKTIGITPWHPIRYKSNWVFPNTINHETGNAEFVYNFVLEDHHIVYLSTNDVESCTFGHGFTDNNVIKHDYFGSQKVINDLQGLENYWEGSCVVSGFIKKKEHFDSICDEVGCVFDSVYDEIVIGLY